MPNGDHRKTLFPASLKRSQLKKPGLRSIFGPSGSEGTSFELPGPEPGAQTAASVPLSHNTFQRPPGKTAAKVGETRLRNPHNSESDGPQDRLNKGNPLLSKSNKVNGMDHHGMKTRYNRYSGSTSISHSI